MNTGNKLAALAAFASAGVTFVLYSVLARTSSKSSSITKGNNNNSASQSNLGLSILLDSAREYYVRGDYKKADIFFERVLEIEPNNIDALNGKGTSLYRLADYDKAKNCFDKVLRMDPKNIVAFDNIEILGKKKDDSSQKIEKPVPSQGPSQKIEKPVPSQGTGTIPRADPRNPYNDPTLPDYNPDLGKKKDDSSQKIEKPAPSQDSGTIPRADPRNPYNDPTLPDYNPDLGKKKDDSGLPHKEPQHSVPSSEPQLEEQYRQPQYQGQPGTKGADLDYLEVTYLKQDRSLRRANLRGRDF